MTRYEFCPSCNVKRLLYSKEQKLWTCFHCFKVMKKVVSVVLSRKP